MKEVIYILRHNKSGFIKFGITGNWQNRARQLRVGKSCEALTVISCQRNKEAEKKLLEQWDKEGKRLPGTEWFSLTQEEANTAIKEVQSLGKEYPRPWTPRYTKKATKAKPDAQPVKTAASKSSQSENFWSTPEGIEQAKAFHETVDLEDLIVLEHSNPWVTGWCEADPSEWCECPGLTIDFTDPMSLGGEQVWVNIDPDESGDGCIADTNSKWLLETFSTYQATLEEVVERLWLLTNLGPNETPLRVTTREYEQRKHKAKLEARWGPMPTDEELITSVREITTAAKTKPDGS